MKLLVQAGPSGHMPAPPKKQFLISSIASFCRFALLFFTPAWALAEDPVPEIVSSASIASFYLSSGAPTNPFGGDLGVDYLFNGDFADDVRMPRLGAGGYMLLNLTNVYAAADKPSTNVYVTDIKVGNHDTLLNSIYYSKDGSNWVTVIEQEAGVVGTITYTVNASAAWIKWVMDEAPGGWGWNPSMCEFQVWGMNPNEMQCLHPAEFRTEWTPVEGTATCTAYGQDSQTCQNCTAVLYRVSEVLLPLGHTYESTCTLTGSFVRYGKGMIECARCDYEICFTNEFTHFTNTVDWVTKGGVEAIGTVQFAEVSATSSGEGVWPGLAINGGWSMVWGDAWYTRYPEDDGQYFQFKFGTTIELTGVRFCVGDVSPGTVNAYRFYSYDGLGEELVGFVRTTAHGDVLDGGGFNECGSRD